MKNLYYYKRLFLGFLMLFLWQNGMGQIVISGVLPNPGGTDGNNEYIQLVATQNIDFSSTNYTVVVANNGNATANGWVACGAITYSYQLKTGSVSAGQVFYVGGSGKILSGTTNTTDISGQTWIRTIETTTTGGDGCGNLQATDGVIGNGGANADGIAVFSGTSITSSSIPVDAIFYGTGVGSAKPTTGGGGYILPTNDIYSNSQGTFGNGSNTTRFSEPAGNQWIKLTGTFNRGTNTWTTARTSSLVTLNSSSTIASINTGLTINNPSIAISANHPAASTLNQGSNNNIIGAIKLDVSTVDAKLNSVTITTSGFYSTSDISNFKFWLSSSATSIAGATQLGSNLSAVSSGSNLSVTGLSNTLSNGSTYYLIVTASVASAATPSNTVGITSTAFSNIQFLSAAKTGTDPVSASNNQTIASSVINITGTLNNFGSILSGSSSTVQNYTVSGANLTDNITITSPNAAFLIGTNNPPTSSNAITISPSSGSVSSTTIYVKFSPSSASGLIAGNISHTSSGVTTQNQAVIGQAIDSEPTTQSAISFGNITATTIEVNLTGGNGSKRIVLVKSSTSVNGTPSDANTYTANSTFGSGSQIGTGNYVVYAGSGNTVTVSGLAASSTYHFAVFEFNDNAGTSGAENYFTTSPGTNNQITATPYYYWNGGDITANPAAGGSGSLGTTNAWRQPDATGSQATWADNNSMIFAGTAGNVTVDANRTATSYTFNTTGYTLQNTATFTLTGPITLANDVVLNLAPNVNTTTPANGTLGISSVNGTGNAAITLHGAQSTSSIASRINISTSSSTISVPTTIVSDGGTGTNGYAGYVSTTTGASINGNITNNSALTTIIGATSGNSLTVNGVISGNAGLQLSAGASGGAGTITLNAANTYSGKTIFNAAVSGTIKLGIDNALSSGKDLIMAYSSSNGGILDLNGYNQNIGSLINRSGGGSITNSAASVGTLTINQAIDTVFSLPITSKVALTKNGANLITLTSGSHSFSGGLTINAGEVRLNPSGNLSLTSSAVTLNGGTLGTTGIKVNRVINFSTISITDNSNIVLSSDSIHSLKFTASNSISWASGKALTITGWQGTAGSVGTKGRIYVGSTISGLTSTQLAAITFTGFNAGATILSTGEIVPKSYNPISAISFTPNCLTSTNINWSLPGDYNNSVNNVLVFVKQGSAITQSTNNNFADTYTASADFTTPGTAYEGDAAAYCVFNGDASSINVTGLSTGTTYYVLIHNTYNNTTYSAALTANSTTVTSLSNATNLASTNDLNQVTLTWTNPSCFDEMMIVSTSNASVSSIPSGDGSAYTANSFYSAGTNTASNEYVVFKGTSTTVTITGLVDGSPFTYKLFTRKGNDWSAGISIQAASNPPAGDYRSKQSGNWSSFSTWQRFNGSAWVDAITGQTPDTATTRVTILNGHSVKYDVSSKDVKDLTINTGGKLSAQDSSDNLKYVNVWGNVVCNGTIGNLPATDDISFRVMGEYCYLSGSGSFGCARLTKTDATNVTSNLIILKDITIVRNAAQSTVLYNNCSTSNFFNVTINPSVTVNVGNALHKANVAIDGTDGAGTGFRAGTLLVNGNLNINGDLYATTNNTNTLYSCAIVVGATGTINADKIIASASAAASHSLSVYEGGNLNLSNSSNPISPYSTTNNYFYFTNSGLSLTLSGSADITLEAGLTYKNITCNSTANLIPNGNLTVTGNIEINSGAFTLVNNNLSLKGNLTSYGTGGFTMGTGTVTLEGTSVQTINTTGGESFSNLVINNSAGVTLNSDVTVSTLLTLTNGKVSTGANNLTIANSSASSLVSTNGWLNGNLVRNIASNTSTYVFPVGDASTKNTLTFVNNNLTGVNTLTSSFGIKQGNDTGLNVILINKPITSVSSNVWQLTPDANPTGGSYDLYLSILNFGGMADNQFTILRRDDNSSSAADWMIPTGSVNGPMLVSNGYASRTNITTFSRYGVGNTSSPVPVTFFQLSAFEQDEKTIVNWTATEINNKEYEIELSNNGVDFETKASIAGKGTTYNNEKYSVIINEINYKYVRIKQIDFDGKYSYSPVFVIAKNKSLNNEINVFPTIISNQEDIFVKVSSVEPTGTSLKIKLVDVLFHQIFEKEITLQQAGNYNLSQEINKNLATGIYFVLINNGLENKSFKIVVE